MQLATRTFRKTFIRFKKQEKESIIIKIQNEKIPGDVIQHDKIR